MADGHKPLADSASADDASADDRRSFLKSASTGAMLTGLAGGYGMLAAQASKFLYPAATKSHAWQFVAVVSEMTIGHSLPFITPSGAKVVIARQSEGDTEADFIALSSVCPHLGCQVHWEAVKDRFFCPCHNGAFDRSGRPTEGPPAAANQSLTRYPLRVENGLLYLFAELSPVVAPAEDTKL